MAGAENGGPAPYGGHMATDEDDVKPIDLETVMDPLGKARARGYITRSKMHQQSEAGSEGGESSNKVAAVEGLGAGAAASAGLAVGAALANEDTVTGSDQPSSTISDDSTAGVQPSDKSAVVPATDAAQEDAEAVAAVDEKARDLSSKAAVGAGAVGAAATAGAIAGGLAEEPAEPLGTVDTSEVPEISSEQGPADMQMESPGSDVHAKDFGWMCFPFAAEEGDGEGDDDDLDEDEDDEGIPIGARVMTAHQGAGTLLSVEDTDPEEEPMGKVQLESGGVALVSGDEVRELSPEEARERTRKSEAAAAAAAAAVLSGLTVGSAVTTSSHGDGSLLSLDESEGTCRVALPSGGVATLPLTEVRPKEEAREQDRELPVGMLGAAAAAGATAFAVGDAVVAKGHGNGEVVSIDEGWEGKGMVKVALESGGVVTVPLSELSKRDTDAKDDAEAAVGKDTSVPFVAMKAEGERKPEAVGDEKADAEEDEELHLVSATISGHEVRYDDAGKRVVMYKMECDTEDGQHFVAFKRYSVFRNLCKSLRAKGMSKADLPTLPHRKLFGNFSEAKIAEREDKLRCFLEAAVNADKMQWGIQIDENTALYKRRKKRLKEDLEPETEEVVEGEGRGSLSAEETSSREASPVASLNKDKVDKGPGNTELGDATSSQQASTNVSADSDSAMRNKEVDIDAPEADPFTEKDTQGLSNGIRPDSEQEVHKESVPSHNPAQTVKAGGH